MTCSCRFSEFDGLITCNNEDSGSEIAIKTTRSSHVESVVLMSRVDKDQMRKFLKFVHGDNVYCKYYEVVYILFHTGIRISEFCGLTMKDVDLENYQ